MKPADDQGGAEQGVLPGEQLAGEGDADESPVLLVHLHAVDHVQLGQQRVAGVDEPVVEVQRLGPGDGALLDTAAQGVESVEGVEDRGQALAVVLVQDLADIGVPGVAADLGERLVRGGPGATQGGERVGGAGVGEVDEGLAALLLDDADRVLDGVADLLHEGRHGEQTVRLTARQYRGEAPDRGQGHQRHEKQRHDLPADRLPAKAHGLPQLEPPASGGTHVRQQTARAYYRRAVNSKSGPEAELPHQRPDMVSCPGNTGDCDPETRLPEKTGIDRPRRGLGQNFRNLGIFTASRASSSLGNGGGIGHRSRRLSPGGVKQSKPGSHWGAGSSTRK